jgi:3-phenylpropionate/trans-cinnamate dioxygenase ferredoxin subunit
MTDASFTPVAKLGDIAIGDKIAIDLGGRSVLICHAHAGVFAIENRCSHMEEPLECGRIRMGFIACPVHGSRFDLETGEALTPPALDPIKTFPVRIVDDMIEVAA